MRNLRNIARTAVHFPETDLPLTGTTWDTANDSLICVFGPSPTQASIELRRTNAFGTEEVASSTSIAVWDAQCPNPDLECDEVLDVHYFADTAVVCLILRGGDIVLVRERPLPDEEPLEIVGSVDSGLQSASWSPDDEVVALVTGEGHVLFMSRDFDTLSEIKMEGKDVRLSRGVDVGWGKRETQFLGKRARALKDPTVPERVDAGILADSDDQRVTISWRGDGHYVAVNSIVNAEGASARRLIRVYSREGHLDSVSEATDFLGAPLSWRPSGNLIAGLTRTETKSEVVFFERNGLRHGGFELRSNRDKLQDYDASNKLHWNADSTVLAVCSEKSVQLWTMGNYHYYLKQEIRLPGANAKVRGMAWHPEQALNLAIHSNEGVWLVGYASSIAKGSTCAPNDHGTVAVIDGSNVKITPLRVANVPPPMSLHEVNLQENIIDVAVNEAGLAVLTAESVSLFHYRASSKAVTEPEQSGKIPWAIENGTPCQLSVLGDILLILAYRADLDETSVWQFFGSDGEWALVDAGSAHISSILPGSNPKTLCIQTRDRSILGLDVGSRDSSLRAVTRLHKHCPWVELAMVEDQEVAFGLTTSGSLYANHVLLVSNCTSFLLTSAHLIFTTTHHLLQFVHLTSIENLEVPPNEPESDERCRSIERGARLITVMPSGYSVVLQMPRGNLETVFPRALVLAGIRKSIEEKKYKKAFLACRSQRVDMNILHDHAPTQFMADVAMFVDQLVKIEYIDLFLSQIRDEDVSKTMYRETTRPQDRPPVSTGVTNGTSEATQALLQNDSKTNKICNAMLDVLQSRKTTNLQNIVTANVCKSPPDLEGGLTVVSKLRIQGEEVAEKAAEHICFLADVNQLYDTALGMYDLETTLLIAQQSQKDPKEYIPYLQALQAMEILRRQFNIDNDLGRCKKAILSLHELDAFEELKVYAEKHELYSVAIELYKYNAARLNELTRLYADYLAARSRFTEAGIAYEFLGDYNDAIPMYRQAQMWREALSCATLVPLSDTDLNSLAVDLADGLIESKEYQSAAAVYLDYLGDVPESAKLLCKAYLFAEAMRIIALRKQPELIEQVIDTGLVEGFTNMTELLADCKSQLNAQVPRLRELRLKKETDPLAFYTGDAVAGEAGADFPDDISLAPTDATTSAGTFMTRYTGRTNGTLNTQTTRRTSKNRRREERKRARGKKGSVYEEEYLVNSIGRLMDRVNETSDDLRRLVEGLVRRTMRERAVVVESAMIEVLVMCDAVLAEVFEVKDEKSPMEVPDGAEEQIVPQGADAVFHDMLTGASKRTPPVIKKFQRLSLIA